ncbi:MAG: ABC transporter permease, partial [Bacteroidota bacterium]
FIDGILGAIGIVALIVAALGIINTMVMSILERTREIGVMKAIGGGEGDIRLVFFVEAIIIGLIGGALGLAAGWVITEIANLVINGYLKPDAASSIDMFHFPLWLIFGALGFSMCVSLAAGVYPAYRAARIDPVEALRHE